MNTKSFILVTVACCMFLPVAHANNNTLGFRVWNAEWDLYFDGDRENLGTEHFYTFLYNRRGQKNNYIFQFGYGEGWDDLTERIDLSFAVTRTRELTNWGVGLRLQDYSWGGDEDWQYFGPELLYNRQFPLSETVFLGLSASLSVFYWSYEWYDTTNSGFTLGNTFDLGLTAVRNSLYFRGGYRLQINHESGDFAGDFFKGLYAEIGVSF